MTTVAVPYYGKLHHCSSGFEKVYFIVNYDTETEVPQDVRLSVWDEKRTPHLDVWLKENGVIGVVCRDAETMPLLEKVVDKGITVLGQRSGCAQTILKKLFL